ncbi:hypothetical protein [Natronosalvus halobius]|uniref:hypothetical protein n=1 Tax=Natronosalvus halobius TaxID=2953746 RepID=UPI00209CD165|nr:hypothetical protein [Natronosalvus halobius]USZ72521.1 hypothetical protein NGM15_04190 [Natronosalvus halobius]
MSARFTPEDVGKRVINEHGDDVGMVTDVDGATAYVEPDPGITDSIKAALSWGSPSDEAITLEESDVSDVTHTEVHLRGPGAMGAEDVDDSSGREMETGSGMEAETGAEMGTEADARRLDEREPKTETRTGVDEREPSEGPGSRETEPNRSEPDRTRGIDEGHGRVSDEDTEKLFDQDEDLFDEGEGVFDDEESAVEADSRSKTADQHHGGLARDRDDEPNRERSADGRSADERSADGRSADERSVDGRNADERSVNDAESDSARKRKAEEMDGVSDSEGDLSEEDGDRRHRGKRRSAEDEDDERII